MEKNKKADGTSIEKLTIENRPAVGSQEWFEQIKRIHDDALIWLESVVDFGGSDISKWTMSDTGFHYLCGTGNNNLPSWRTVQDMDNILHNLNKAQSAGYELGDLKMVVDGIVAYYLAIVEQRTEFGPFRKYDPTPFATILKSVNAGHSLEAVYGRIVQRNFKNRFTGTSGSTSSSIVVKKFFKSLGGIAEHDPVVSLTAIDDFNRYVLPTISSHRNFFKHLMVASYGAIMAGNSHRNWNSYPEGNSEVEKIIDEMVLNPSSIVLYSQYHPTENFYRSWSERSPINNETNSQNFNTVNKQQ